MKSAVTVYVPRVSGAVKAAAAGLSALALTGAAHAQTATGIDSLFDAVDFAGVATKVIAVGVVVVGIAMALKGISLVKRVIGKA